MRYLIVLLLFIFSACMTEFKGKPETAFDLMEKPALPDYAQEENWSALPTKQDKADKLAKGLEDVQAEAKVDIFFVHPTTYMGNKKWQNTWNAPIDEDRINGKTDRKPVKFQASVFNGVGRVFVPRYRQAHLYAYFTKDKPEAEKAFAEAYKDVKAAFEYYLEHYNEGRPIIIAAHSQGTTHAVPLMAEFFDNKKLQEQLVVAYLVGLPVRPDQFEKLKPCEGPEETGCFCTWQTYRRGYVPEYYKSGNLEKGLVTNPINWKLGEEGSTDYSEHKGAVLLNFKIKKAKTNADCHRGLLWVDKPKIFGIGVMGKNYHALDYNLFYLDIRENAKLRAEQFILAR